MNPQPQRYFICAGVSEYQHLADLPGVKEETRTIIRLMKDLGYTQALEHLALRENGHCHTLTNHQFLNELEDWFKQRTRDQRCQNDTVVLYITGHGKYLRNEQTFFLMLSESDADALRRTAVNIEDLVSRTLNTAQGNPAAPGFRSCSQLLIILDTCLSGDGAVQAAKATLTLAQAVTSRPQLLVIPTTDVDNEAGQRFFARALDHVLKYQPNVKG